MVIEAYTKFSAITVESSNISYQMRKVNIITKNLLMLQGIPRKQTWLLINQLRGRQRRTMKPVFIIDNERIIERRVIANEFNKYFVSFASKLNDEVEIQSGDFSNFLPRSQLRGGGGGPMGIFL